MFNYQSTLFYALVVCIFGWIQPGLGQDISGIVTTLDQNQLIQPIDSSSLKFAPGNGNADISIDETTVYQQIEGFGGSITDSAALAMYNLKNANSTMYDQFLQAAFTPQGAALNYLRVPIGSSDFSSDVYTFDDKRGDTSFTSFNISKAPSYLFSVLADIKKVNPNAKIHILPWSPPAWMKTTDTLNGGSLKSEMVSIYHTYLLKAVQGFNNMSLPVHAISIQNEPENSNPTYPSCNIPADQQATIAKSLRAELNNNNLSSVKIIGYEHNWDGAGSYAVPMVSDSDNDSSDNNDNDSAQTFAGVSFHCYAGVPDDTTQFSSKFPAVPMYQTECAGTPGSDWGTDVQWYVQNLWTTPNTVSGLMWIFASEDNGKAPYPGSDSCGNGCRGMTTVTTSSITLNQEYYSMAHYARAFTSDDGSTIGQRIAATGGSGLNVAAYAVGNKYSLVVLNPDSEVEQTISFQGNQVSYKFPTGLTTLWWTGSTSTTTSSKRRLHRKRRPFTI
ncbi:glycoside hydrolase superfamily [Rhodocollybia butyracea]|uniref:Glycoside hydrolase superfamily n=1 Tax=Rhodocollybia butyracea TaxID=206335 RepID=A0A9P5PZQ8_9AGAR|nr:glycoside hydrolase superfamily [Rhodocollybia butyracea]